MKNTIRKYISAALVLFIFMGTMPWTTYALSETELPGAETETFAAVETAEVLAEDASAEPRVITGFDMSQVEVDRILSYGTPETDLGLPTHLPVVYSDSATGEVAVSWICTEDGLGASVYNPLHENPQQAVFRFEAKLAEEISCSAAMPVIFVRFNPASYIDVGYRLEDGVLYITAVVSLEDVLEAEGIAAEEIRSIIIEENGCLTGGEYAGEVTNRFLIRGGNYTGKIINYGIVEGGEFGAEGRVENFGSLEGGHYAGTVKNSNGEEDGTGFIFGELFDQSVTSADKSFALDFTRHYCLYGDTLYFAVPNPPEYTIDYIEESVTFTPCLTWEESILQRREGETWVEIPGTIRLSSFSLPGAQEGLLPVRQLCGENASEILQVVIPARPKITDPKKLLTISKIGEKEVTFTCAAGYEARIVDAKQQVCENGKLTAGTEYTFQLRKPATEESFASAWTDAQKITTVRAQKMKCSIDYQTEEIVIEAPVPLKDVVNCKITAPTWNHVVMNAADSAGPDGEIRVPIKKITNSSQMVHIEMNYRDSKGAETVSSMNINVPARKNYVGMGVVVDHLRLTPQSMGIRWVTEKLAYKDEAAICAHGADTSHLTIAKGSIFNNLKPQTGYDVYVRNRATTKAFASHWWKSIDNVKTPALPTSQPVSTPTVTPYATPKPTPAPGGGNATPVATQRPHIEGEEDVQDVPVFHLSDEEAEVAGEAGVRLYRDYLGNGYGLEELYLLWDSEELEALRQTPGAEVNADSCQPQGYQLLPVFRGDSAENYHSMLISALYGDDEDAQPRTLRMSLLQFRRMYAYLGISELVFRNGPAEISLTIDELMMGDIAKLSQLMLTSNETIDLLDVDFAVLDEVEILDEQMAELYLEIQINPTPLESGQDAWTFTIWLCRGESRVNISVLLYSLLIGMDSTDVIDEIDSWDVGLVDMEGEFIPMGAERFTRPEPMPEELEDTAELFTVTPVIAEDMETVTVEFLFEEKADLVPFRKEVLSTIHAGFGSYVLFSPADYY